MRFDKLVYSHTDCNKNIKKIKFVAINSKIRDITLSVEIRKQDDKLGIIARDIFTKEVGRVTKKEREFILDYARKVKLI